MASSTTQFVDGWLLRRAPELPFRRANSATAIGTPGELPLPEIERFYTGHGPVRVQVHIGSPVDTQLATLGYEIEAPVDVMVADIATMIAYAPITADTLVGSRLDDRFAFDSRCAAYGTMLERLGPSARVVTATADGVPSGVAFAVVERGWCGIFGMVVQTEARRRGIATALLGTIATEAQHLDATRCYLQVEQENAAARALYTRNGFTPEYSYHYRTRG